MKTSFPSIISYLVIVASILVWIGGVSMALVYFLGLSDPVGWWIAGSLGFSSLTATTVILYEMRHAVEIDAAAGGSELADFDGPVPWNLPGMGSKRFIQV